MLPFPDNTQTDVIEPFNSTSRYLVYDLLNIDDPYFEEMSVRYMPQNFI